MRVGDYYIEKLLVDKLLKDYPDTIISSANLPLVPEKKLVKDVIHHCYSTHTMRASDDLTDYITWCKSLIKPQDKVLVLKPVKMKEIPFHGMSNVISYESNFILGTNRYSDYDLVIDLSLRFPRLEQAQVELFCSTPKMEEYKLCCRAMQAYYRVARNCSKPVRIISYDRAIADWLKAFNEFKQTIGKYEIICREKGTAETWCDRYEQAEQMIEAQRVKMTQRNQRVNATTNKIHNAAKNAKYNKFKPQNQKKVFKFDKAGDVFTGTYDEAKLHYKCGLTTVKKYRV